MENDVGPPRDNYLWVGQGPPRQPRKGPIRRLTLRHVRILLIYLSGISMSQVAEACRVSPYTVHRIVNDPLGQAFIRQQIEDVEHEFRALIRPAIETIRDGMDSGRDMKDRLRAADMFFKRRGDYKDGVEKNDTAEDVVRKILVGVQVNVNTGPSAERGLGYQASGYQASDPAPLLPGTMEAKRDDK